MTKNSSTDSSKKKKSKNKVIKKKLSVRSSEAKNAKQAKENPFESIWSRRKFDVLGKKRKDEERRRVGRSRSLAIQKREKTLLKEYEQSKKSSVFMDKRIGEQDEGLGEFDKAIIRSQRERQLNLKKKSKFNLSDGEEDDFEFPDSGYPVRDDFEDEEPLDGDDGESLGSGKKFNLRHLNSHEPEDVQGLGSEGAEQRPKSKKEVMEDVISKSKFFKAQKAKDKEENEQLVEQLDKDFTSLVQSDALSSLTQPNKIKALNALVNSSLPGDNIKEEAQKVSLPLEKPDQYDKLIGQMALDMRARPSDRTKTQEELAQEEKERLEQLEEDRQKRMQAVDDSGDEDGNTSEDEKPIRHISGDDLGDSLSHDDKSANKVGWIQEILRRENADRHEGEDAGSSEDSEEEEDDDDDEDDEDEEGEDEDGESEDDGEDNVEDEKANSLKDWEQSSDDDIETNLEDEEDGGSESDDAKDISEKVAKVGPKNIIQKDKQKDGAGSHKVQTKVKEHAHQKELPYTIEAPKNFEELDSLFENLSDDQIVEAVRRIRTFNAISIAAENRKKMQVFYGVLLQYFAVLANQKPLKFKLLNMLVKPLMEMSTEIPYFAAICARQRLLHIRNQFCKDIKNTGQSCWPSLKTLFLLRLWSMIFPCSDFRHAVMTPAMLLMSEYLMRCPITSGRDIAVGSFLCSMVLSVCRQSKKFCPEAVTFIQTMLMAALNDKQKFETSQLYRLMELKTLRPLLILQGKVTEIKPLDFLMLMDLPDDSSYFTSDDFRTSILYAIMKNLMGFAKIYEELKSFPEIFLPISKVLCGLAEQDHMLDALKTAIKDASQHIENKSNEHHLLRRPLRIRKPKIIKTLVPKFEDNFIKGRDYDPDKERAERKKLKKRLKQEHKGAIRELRKDNHFLMEVKDREKAQMAEERAEQFRKYKAFLEDQEHAFKSGQLGKGRKRSR